MKIVIACANTHGCCAHKERAARDAGDVPQAKGAPGHARDCTAPSHRQQHRLPGAACTPRTARAGRPFHSAGQQANKHASTRTRTHAHEVSSHPDATTPLTAPRPPPPTRAPARRPTPAPPPAPTANYPVHLGHTRPRRPPWLPRRRPGSTTRSTHAAAGPQQAAAHAPAVPSRGCDAALLRARAQRPAARTPPPAAARCWLPAARCSGARCCCRRRCCCCWLPGAARHAHARLCVRARRAARASP
jgi:hypothetical protein